MQQIETGSETCRGQFVFCFFFAGGGKDAVWLGVGVPRAGIGPGNVGRRLSVLLLLLPPSIHAMAAMTRGLCLICGGHCRQRMLLPCDV